MRKLYHNDFDVSSALKQSGSFVYVPIPLPFEAEVMIVAGGGSGGDDAISPSAGGGAGGVISGTITIGTGEIDITIGSGGSVVNNSRGDNGEDTVVSGSNLNIIALGGGGGGSSGKPSDGPGSDGGSGGGGSWSIGGTGDAGVGLQPLSGSNNFGNDGGVGTTGNRGGAGGGGASAAGEDYDGVLFGAGGAGIISTISGTSIQYAKGGGSSNSGESRLNTPGSGGIGNQTSQNAGRSGIVIIRYEGPTIKARGGTLTKVGGDFVHTFTSDGILYN